MKTIKRGIILFCFVTIMSYNIAEAQDNRVIRIAKIKIDAAHIEEYKVAVREQIETAVRVEAGVLTLYAVHDKKDPTSVTVFEIYADQAAYQSHIQTEHFKKYKTSTANMVKSLELIDVSSIATESKK
ncbi:MAG: putative quinol monooxygenase [Bacteroidota bacterium]